MLRSIIIRSFTIPLCHAIGLSIFKSFPTTHFFHDTFKMWTKTNKSLYNTKFLCVSLCNPIFSILFLSFLTLRCVSFLCLVQHWTHCPCLNKYWDFGIRQIQNLNFYIPHYFCYWIRWYCAMEYWYILCKSLPQSAITHDYFFLDQI